MRDFFFGTGRPAGASISGRAADTGSARDGRPLDSGGKLHRNRLVAPADAPRLKHLGGKWQIQAKNPTKPWRFSIRWRSTQFARSQF